MSVLSSKKTTNISRTTRQLSLGSVAKHIKKTCCICLAFLLCACASSDRQALINYQKGNEDYFALKQTIANRLADSTTFDRILKVYPYTSLYSPKSDTDAAGKLLSEQYMREQNYFACLQVSEKMLEANYTSLTAHFAAGECSARAGNDRAGNFHAWVLDNLIEAIWRTGNGQSARSAFIINSTSDLYAFIQLHQLVVVAQELVYLQQVPIQKITILTPETNRESVWYFNVSPLFTRGILEHLQNN